MSNKYDKLKLENQLCFPLYAASKEIVRHYKPFLDKLDMTYTQYIAMMVLWEHKKLTVKELGEYLYLDSGTLTPLLKTMEKKGWVERNRSKEDERVLNVTITKQGEALREQALSVPEQMAGCVHLKQEEIAQLYQLLYKILDNL
ncbi:MAG: MarR family transcriptional regulator [Roseburia sp. 40_7]|nr:MAG: MarR family transcriptional regulator [Roseburia sp. 40_7]